MKPLFFANIGDLHYAGTKYSTSEDFQVAFHEVFKSQSQREFLQQTPLVYVLDDHDAGANNVDGFEQSIIEANIAFRTLVPHYPLPQYHGLWQSFNVGRIKFLVTDSRSYLYTRNTDENGTEGKSETYFGREQFRWILKSLEDAASDP